MRISSFAITTLATLSLCAIASGQAADTPYQTRIASYLDRVSTFVNVTNSGATSTVAFPTQNGALCANFYVSAANAANNVLACCSCLIQPGAIASVNVLSDLLANVMPPTNSVTVKVMASTGSGGVCNASTVGTGANVLATGLVPLMSQGYGTNVNAIPFTPSTLSAAELTALDTLCGAKPGAGGACSICRVGAN